MTSLNLGKTLGSDHLTLMFFMHLKGTRDYQTHEQLGHRSIWALRALVHLFSRLKVILVSF